MRPRVLLALVVLTVLGLVAAVVVRTGGPAEAPAGIQRPATTGAPLPPGPVDRYVALGDSYTAGPLIPWVRNDPAACLRSTRNYPAVLAQWLDAGTLVDASCSGADTGDVRAPQRSFGPPVPPQLGAVTADTDLVTVGIGGNDSDLFSTLVGGVRPSDVRAVLDGTGRRVAGVVRAVQDRASQAVVAVVGYPRIVPARGGCATLPFGRADTRYLDRVERWLNAELRSAAVAQDAVYVDTYGPSHGHDVCAGAGAWVNGSRTRALQALAFHPLARGMQATAAAVYEALRGEQPTPAEQRRAAAALGHRPADALRRSGQRLAAALLGG